MNFLIIAAGLAAFVFFLSYMRPGRLGAAILALSAGYVVAITWTDTIAGYPGVTLPGITWRDTVYGLLILLPGLLALFFAPKQKSILPRPVSAATIAVFGVALLLPILGIGSEGYAVLVMMKNYRETVIVALIIIGLLDLFLARSEKKTKHSHGGHD